MRDVKKIGLILFVSLFGLLIWSQTGIKQKQSQLKSLEKEVQSLKKMIDNTNQGQQASLGKYRVLQQLVSTRKSYIEELEYEIENLETNLSDSEELINALQRDVDSLKNDYAEMIFASEKMSFSSDRLTLLFSAQSYNQLAMRLKFLRHFSDVKKEQVEKIEKVQSTLLNEKTIVASKYEDKKLALKKIISEKAQLSNEMIQVDDQYNALVNQEKELRDNLKQKEREIKIIKQAIKELMAEARKKPDANSGILSKNFASNKGRLPWPIKTNRFVSWSQGVNPHPTISGVEVNNLGIGIQTSEGASVFACFEGEVRKVLNIPGSGQTVMVKHGDYFTLYGRMKNIAVQPGTKVYTGQLLGEVMEVNGSSALDFQVWHKQENDNPKLWLTR